MKRKIILDLCGGTGGWSRPYEEAGYDVRLVTLPWTDVREYDPPRRVHGVLAAPPCTHFTRSGAQYWPAKDADGRTADAVSIVLACLSIIERTRPVWWALENPVGRLRRLVPELGPWRLSFNPCDYGDPWTKRTLVWGEFAVPEMAPVLPVRACRAGSWLMTLAGRGRRTKELRSITPPAFARAFFEANP